jgi:putative ABC transport system permease protein
MLTRLRQDVKYAAVTSLRQPAVSLGIILTIALGIGATTAIFSVVNTLLLRPLPYPNPERLVSIGTADVKEHAQRALLVPALLSDLQAQSKVVQRFWGFSPVWSLTLTNAGTPYRVHAAYVTPGLLESLGFHLVAGRNFLAAEEVVGGERVALATQAFWIRTFGANAEVGNRLLTLDDQTYRVVGLLSDQKGLPTVDAELYLPFSLNSFVTSRVAPVMNVIGPLREGATLSQAQSEMDGMTQAMQKDYPSLKSKHLVVSSLRDLVVGDLRGTLLMLFAAGGFLVLIACANVANLLLSRAMAREQEMALRAALGATQRRLMQQLLTESLFLALAGGLLGLGLATAIVRVIPLLPFGFALSDNIQIDGTVLAFTSALSLLMGLVFGLAPALHAVMPNLIGSLRSGTRTSMGASSRRLWNVLIVAEVALSLVVLVGAGLLIRSFWKLSHVDPGFRTAHIMTTNIFLPEARYRDNAGRVSFFNQLTERLKTLPGVQSVGLVNRLPLSGSNVMVGVTVDGSPLTAGKPEMIDRRVADPDYFRTVGVPLVKGRYFTAQDSPHSAKVGIVNEAMARRFWPNDDNLIGRRAVLGAADGMPVTIVGVVRNVLHHGLDTQVQPELYVPYTQSAPPSMVVAMLITQPSATLANTVRAQVSALDPQLPLDNMPTIEQVVATSISRPRFRTLLLSSFAVLALLLSAIGIYSVVSYATSRRRAEIAIRMALGAQRSSILMLVLGHGAKLTIAGVVIGLTASFMLMQFLRTLLFGISDSDPVTLIAVAALMAVVALAACYLPVRRALQTDPLAALRVD